MKIYIHLRVKNSRWSKINTYEQNVFVFADFEFVHEHVWLYDLNVADRRIFYNSKVFISNQYNPPGVINFHVKKSVKQLDVYTPPYWTPVILHLKFRILTI